MIAELLKIRNMGVLRQGQLIGVAEFFSSNAVAVVAAATAVGLVQRVVCCRGTST